MKPKHDVQISKIFVRQQKQMCAAFDIKSVTSKDFDVLCFEEYWSLKEVVAKNSGHTGRAITPCSEKTKSAHSRHVDPGKELLISS